MRSITSNPINISTVANAQHLAKNRFCEILVHENGMEVTNKNFPCPDTEREEIWDRNPGYVQVKATHLTWYAADHVEYRNKSFELGFADGYTGSHNLYPRSTCKDQYNRGKEIGEEIKKTPRHIEQIVNMYR